ECEGRARQKEQTLLFSPASVPALLWVDGDKIKRAVRHLLLNAFNFTPAGGVIDVSVDRVEDEVVIRVRDTGQGIDETHLPYIFEPFYKADPALQTDFGGVGLGLTVVRLIAAEHKGRINAESVPGKGSVFTLRLPIQTQI
ncbi:MAG: ATP-binding protein, partial [Candidatus Sumerlaeia bacterium]|nr:ATP-binding protein [Candidatus Sumerlaeia bacterium]